MTQTMKETIQQLTHEMNQADILYRLGEPTMSDAEFDRKMRELKKLEEDYPEYKCPYSPTDRIGTEPLTGLIRVKHSEPMLSISNVYNIDDLEKWFDSTNAGSYTAEYKIDGVAVSLIYENGKLAQALTRGDGVEGDDVTHNIRTIAGLPLELKGEGRRLGRLEIRGEVYMPTTMFTRWNESTGNKYKNARNACAGAVRLLDPRECARRPLAFIAHSATHDPTINSHEQFLRRMKTLGFKIAPYPIVIDGNEVTRYSFDRTTLSDYFRNEYQTGNDKLQLIDRYDFEIDGVVIKVNDFAQRERIGFTSHSPKWAIALKVENYEANTRLNSVDWQVGKTGILTPVARLEPVEIDGTTVSNASLHNLDVIKTLGLKIGCKVRVKKAGKVIPAIDCVVEHDENGTEIIPPDHCPSCYGAITVHQDENRCTTVRCENSLCEAQRMTRIQFYVSRAAVNMVGIGEQLIEWLVEKKIADFMDLYRLSYDDLIEAPHLGEKSARKIWDTIQSHKNPPLEKFLIGLGLPGAGAGTAKRLCRVYTSLGEIASAMAEELERIPDIGKLTAENIERFFKSDYWRNLRNKMTSFGVYPQDVPKKEPVVSENLPLAGLSIAVSGTLSGHKRDEIQAVIERHGGKYSGSVSKKTDYLLLGVDGGSKESKARQLGVKIIDEQEFNRMIG